jgi:hypothetical protein
MAASNSEKPKSSGGCGGCFLTGCLVLIVLILVVGVGGFLAFRSGAITTTTLTTTVLNLLGRGPATIEVDNFRDDIIQVTINPVDSSKESTKDSSAVAGQLSLKPFDIVHYQAQNPGRYQVAFVYASEAGSGNLGSCTLTVRGGDQYQFVTLPDRIAVNRVNNPSSVGSDFVIDTSSLCR